MSYILLFFHYLVLGLIAPVRAIYKAIRAAAKGAEKVKGFLLKRGFYYHRGHTWLRLEGDRVRVGLDDFAQRLVGGIDGISMPTKGSKIRAGEGAWNLRCGERSVKMLSPIDGMVVAVNEALIRDVSLISKDPYGHGWVFIIQPSNGGLKRLLYGNAAKSWLAGEADRLHQILEAEMGVTVTDGGELEKCLYIKLDEEQWSGLISKFFLAG